MKTKNEQVVGRNNYRRARPCKGAKLTPGLWIGGTKEVRTHKVMILVDTGDGRVYRGHLKRNKEDVLFRIPKTSYFRTRYREIFIITVHLSEIDI